MFNILLTFTGVFMVGAIQQNTNINVSDTERNNKMSFQTEKSLNRQKISLAVLGVALAVLCIGSIGTMLWCVIATPPSWIIIAKAARVVGYGCCLGIGLVGYANVKVECKLMNERNLRKGAWPA